MDKFLGTLVVLILIGTALSLMWSSWRRRTRRDLLLATSVTPHGDGPRLFECECLYVATTPRDHPLERLAIPGLAFRARATIVIEALGLVIEPRGELTTVIAREQIDGVREADATIDRSAGRGSLTAIDWTAANGGELTSFFRIPRRLDREVFVAAITDYLAPREMREIQP